MNERVLGEGSIIITPASDPATTCGRVSCMAGRGKERMSDQSGICVVQCVCLCYQSVWESLSLGVGRFIFAGEETEFAGFRLLLVAADVSLRVLNVFLPFI